MTNAWKGIDPNLLNIGAKSLTDSIQQMPQPLENLSGSISQILKDRAEREQQQKQDALEMLKYRSLEGRRNFLEELARNKDERAEALQGYRLLSERANALEDKREYLKNVQTEEDIRNVRGAVEAGLDANKSKEEMLGVVLENYPEEVVAEIPQLEEAYADLLAKRAAEEARLRAKGTSRGTAEGKAIATRERLQQLTEGLNGRRTKDKGIFLNNDEYRLGFNPLIDNEFRDAGFVALPTKGGVKWVPENSLAPTDKPTNPADTMAALVKTDLGEVIGLQAKDASFLGFFTDKRNDRVLKEDYKNLAEDSVTRKIIDAVHELAEFYGTKTAAFNVVNAAIESNEKVLNNPEDILTFLTGEIARRKAPVTSDIFKAPTE